MTTALRLFGALALCLALAAPALAADYSGHFGDMDTNSDGSVDMTEFHHFFKHGDAHAKFMRADTDKSGGIDHDEWHSFKEQHGYGHDEGKDQGHDKGKGHDGHNHG